MKDAHTDSQSPLMRARLADFCLITALLLVLVISWNDSASGSQDLRQAARQAMAQHVGEATRQEPTFIEPTALHANTSN